MCGVAVSLQAALSGHTIVVYEVVLSVHRLVRRYSGQLSHLEWEMVYGILRATQQHLQQANEVSQGTVWHVYTPTYHPPPPSSPPAQASREPGSTPANQLVHTLQDIYSTIEILYEGGANSIGPAHCFFELLESSRDTLPVS